MIVLSTILASIRLLLFAIITSLFFCFVIIANLAFGTNEQQKFERAIKYRRKTIKILHFVLGSKIISYGKLPATNGLIISNHRSYFDPVVILNNILAYPIAKYEVSSWPLIGTACKLTGVIFVNRENKTSRKKTQQELKTVLEKGYSILNTPEGTTHNKPTTLVFKPGAFIQAAALKIPVIPIAIDYKNLEDAWIGNDTFVPHFLRCFGKWRTEIKISYLEPIISDNPEFLIESSKNQIDSELLRFRKEWDSED